MAKYIVEIGQRQFDVEANSPEEAIREHLQFQSNWHGLLETYDDESDPHGSYHRHGEVAWQFVKISVGKATHCEEMGCDLDREEDSEFCEDHQEQTA